ncbi:accessory factor UbiK family protein [Kordiimonas marina]|uniref:accessory factor UbiK family protein n=1 Tax=Kordiimonas marina TaxID=2872312 RepID=UPI001FF194FC|nr:accessory factor UbiK family protein [Kordiimonas marina]MCJ9429701.1 accessory factor UbiK family protein [Kordiimonas marina]
MQTSNKIFDDIAKLATGAVGAAHSVKAEMEDHFRAWLDRQLSQMDLVSREEFEVVRDMAEKARLENEALRAEIDALKKKTPAKAAKKA